MRKEVLFAIIAGSLFGLVIAFGIWRANLALKPNNGQVSSTPLPETSESVEGFHIALARPEENDIITESPTAISGITKANSWVVISAEEEDYIIKSNDDGSFEQEVELEGGLNQILITDFGENGTSTKEVLSVVYSTEFLREEDEEEELPVEESEEKSTEAADAVREKVQKKVEEARKKPKAYLGTITDIAGSNIQIKSPEEEILQISVDEETTTFVKEAKTKTEVDFTDIAIGDFIIAMGYRNSNDVLETTRVLLTDAPEPINRVVISGKVASIKNGEVRLINDVDDKEYTVEPSTKITVTIVEDEEATEIEFSDIEEGQSLIVIGEFEEDILEARTIQAISVPEEEAEESTPSAETEE
jgi:hypothetical protein